MPGAHKTTLYIASLCTKSPSDMMGYGYVAITITQYRNNRGETILVSELSGCG